MIATASDVLAGQTAIWYTEFADQITISETEVTSSSSSAERGPRRSGDHVPGTQGSD